MTRREGVLQRESHIAEFNPELVKIIVFDVDETLVHGTTEVKDKVWTTVLFPKRTEEVEQVNRMFDRLEPFPDGSFHQGDRRDRIAYMLGMWNADDNSYRGDAEVIRMSDLFEESVKKGVQEKVVAEEDVKILKDLNSRFLLHVVSNVPKDIVQANLEHYGIAKYFRTITGTPVKKPEALQHIIDTANCSPEELLMVGDGEPDHDAAMDVGTQFVGVSKDKWPDETFPKVASISELAQVLPL